MAASTDDVTNQPPPYVDIDLFGADRMLQEAAAANGAGAAAVSLLKFGWRWGSAEMFERARLANDNPPRLRGDVIEFHPAYHALMAESIEAGLHASTWQSDAAPAAAPAEVARAARYMMVAQVENGHMCPITMTRAAVAALAAEPSLLRQLMPKIASHDYDPSFRPWPEKSGMTLGMGMTERQGGTDVRSNSTRAEPAGDHYAITGHKWFMSAPMCDAFLVLAQAPAGLSCFLMPRFRPDGTVNGLKFIRLKDKLGNRSNASSEVEFENAFAWRVGEEGRGIRTILQMVQLTRLDCAISSAGMIRAALARAVHHCRHRSVFQKRLIDQSMMRAVLSDIALDVEGAIAVVMRLCRSFDLAADNPSEAARARLLTPAIKYWVCKTAPALIYEAMECLGGNGYIEDYALARLYREAPVNAIWEGSGNVMGLDVLRALSRDRDAAGELVKALAHETRGLPGAAQCIEDLTKLLQSAEIESQARVAVESLARLAAAAALAAAVPSQVAEIFARTRFATHRGVTYGASRLGAADVDAVIERALPM